MRLSRGVRLVLTGICAMALLGTTAAQATAAVSTSETPTPGYYIIDRATAVQVGDATFYPLKNLPEGTITVMPDPDGSLPVTTAQLDRIVAAKASGDATVMRRVQAEIQAETQPAAVEALASCWGYVAPYHMWSGVYLGTAIWGYDESARVTYSFGVTPGTNQQAAGQGVGWWYGYNGSDFGLWRAWYNIGTATSLSSPSYTVPWGENLARTEFKAYSINFSLATGCWMP